MLTRSDSRWWERLERLWGLVVGRSRNERWTGGGRSEGVVYRNELWFRNWSWSRSESLLSWRSRFERSGSWSWCRSEGLLLRGTRFEWCRRRSEGLLSDSRFERLRSWSRGRSRSEDRIGCWHGWWWSLDRLRCREGFGWLVRLVLHALRVLLLSQVRSLQLVCRRKG